MQKWYNKASVQGAIVGGLFLTLAALIPTCMRVHTLESTTERLSEDLSNKTAEIIRLETQLTPFRTLALANYGGPEDAALSKLAIRIGELEANLLALSRYSKVARLNHFGHTGRAGFGLIESSPIGDMLAGCYTNINGKTYPSPSPESIKAFLQVTEQYPDFPFSYYALASIYKANNLPGWEYYARMGINILEKTTQIADRNPMHDEVLEVLRGMLSSETTQHVPPGDTR